MDLPHDWASRQMDKDHPSGRGWLLPTGIAGTAKFVPAACGRRVFIESTGYGQQRFISTENYWKTPNGYVSFSYDMSEHLRYGENNQLSVRWTIPYNRLRAVTGSGINRHVRMSIKSPCICRNGGLFVRSSKSARNGQNC